MIYPDAKPGFLRIREGKTLAGDSYKMLEAFYSGYGWYGEELLGYEKGADNEKSDIEDHN
jgi:hypothetical protein